MSRQLKVLIVHFIQGNFTKNVKQKIGHSRFIRSEYRTFNLPVLLRLFHVHASLEWAGLLFWAYVLCHELQREMTWKCRRHVHEKVFVQRI